MPDHVPVMGIDPETGEEIMLLNVQGAETPDPASMEPPLGWVDQPSLIEQVRAAVRSEALKLAAEQDGFGSFEEEDDFEIGDDYEPTSPYENEFEPSIAELARVGADMLARERIKAEALAAGKPETVRQDPQPENILDEPPAPDENGNP